MASFCRCMVLIDWGAARKLAKTTTTKKNADKVNQITSAFQRLNEKVRRAVTSIPDHRYYQLSRRVYNGWYTGKTKSDEHLAFENAQYPLGRVERGEDDTELPRSVLDRVTLKGDIELATSMLCGGPNALVHDTLIGKKDRSFRRDNKEQRMVDVFLACDILQIARNKHWDMTIVVADDTDLWPAIFAADQWGHAIKLMRATRQNENQHLDTDRFLIGRDQSC